MTEATTEMAWSTTASDLERQPLQRTNPRGGWFRGAIGDWRDVLTHRELLWSLVKKEIKVKYKDSVLGFIWTLARPALQLFVYWLAMGIILKNSTPQFPIMLFTGLVIWNTFAEIVSSSTATIVVNAGLIKKVYFPREMFPLSCLGAAFINFGFQLIVLFAAEILAGVNGHWPDLAALPYALWAMLIVALLGGALGFVTSAINVYLRDMMYIVEIVMMLWFWLCPIVYSIHQVTDNLHGIALQLYMADPMVPVAIAFQKVFWTAGQTTFPGNPSQTYAYQGHLEIRLLISTAMCAVLFYFGQRIFARSQGNFAQEL